MKYRNQNRASFRVASHALFATVFAVIAVVSLHFLGLGWMVVWLPWAAVIVVIFCL